MSFSLDPTMKHQIDGMVRDLCSEFAGQFERAQIEEVMNNSVERVVETATVFDFVPLMAYRHTRRASERDQARPTPRRPGSLGCRVRQPQRRGARPDRGRAHDTAFGQPCCRSFGWNRGPRSDRPSPASRDRRAGRRPRSGVRPPGHRRGATRGRCDRDNGSQRWGDRHTTRRSTRGLASRRPDRCSDRRNPAGPRRHRTPRHGAAERTRRTDESPRARRRRAIGWRHSGRTALVSANNP